MRRNLSFINLIKFLCANVVILCHYVLAFLPYILIGAEEKIHFGKFEKLIRDSVLYTLVNGTFCVYVFWVISGFLIYYAHSYDNTGKRQVKMALSKYFKPLAGIFLTNFLAYALQKVGAMRNIDASVIAHSEYQIASYYQNKASIIRLFYESLIGIYLDDPFKIYVNPLWTMKIEILGSFFLIILLSLSKQVKRNWALALITALGCFLIDVRIICFVFGALCAAYFVRKKNIHYSWGIVACIIAIVLCAGNSTLLNRLYTCSVSFFQIEINIGYVYQSIMAAILVLGVVIIGKNRMNPNGNRFDTGNMSMYLYFFHWPILFSFSCELLILGMKFWNDYLSAAVFAMTGGICLTYLVYITLMKLIDARWNGICKKITDYLCVKE